MARRQRRAGVYGPYRHYDRWRVVRVAGDGTRDVESYETQEQAARVAAALRATAAEAAATTVREWVERLLKPTDSRAIYLRTMLPLGGIADVAPVEVTPESARRTYRALREAKRASGKPYAVTTCHFSLRAARWLWRQLVAEGAVVSNPWVEIRPVGRPHRGKFQIRRTEAIAWIDEAWRQAWAGSHGALGCVIGLFCGLRSGETRGLQARDVMDGGALLHVPGTKTEDAERDLEIGVPELARLLVASCAGLRPTDRLVPVGTHRLRRVVTEIALAAGVPDEDARRLCYQSLRGMAETLARRGGGVPELVAKGLGHTLTVAERHYVAPGATATMRQVGVAASVSRAFPATLQVPEKRPK